jgi:hypothetical protein
MYSSSRHVDVLYFLFTGICPTGFFGYSAGRRIQEDFVPQSSVLFPERLIE